jgi:NDP-sugar pyrophosphorylase family protein
MGIYALDSDVISFLKGGRMDMPSLLEIIRSATAGVYLLESQSYWQDIGRITDFEKASKDFENDPDKFFKANSG